ncbi:hypothetical protein FALBO_8466 [Fusarium albosuccineum]|uniref:F-box domain-containing protein n=1 Tax=Fusarium albosuccineum TaxID=1237068 RepID=A0A8H4L9K7_9HYPO|nr:hypothetical protein FALBO_8466 [Fusarium albosuccineum]
MAQASLLDCPKEVQLAIAEYLAPSDLVILSRASQGLHRLAEPLIYSAIEVSWTLQCHPPVTQLLRTLLEKPEIASRVRRLDLCGHGLTNEFGDLEKSDILPSTVPLPIGKLSEAVKNIEVSKTADTWIDKVQLGATDAVVALLISLMPSLEWLSLSANWTNETRFLGTMFRSALCDTHKDASNHQPTRFVSLKHVSLSPAIDTEKHLDPENTADALALFYLPKIQHLSVSIDNPTRFSWPSSAPPNPKFLSSLELHRIRESRILPILSVTEGLKKLRYNWIYRGDLDSEVSSRIVRLDMMATAFAKASNSLEELEIHAETLPAASEGEYEPPEVTLQGSLTQLSKMHRLKRLYVPWGFLIGSDDYATTGRIGPALPPSLEHLTLAGGFVECEELDDPDDTMISTFQMELESGSLAHLTSLKAVCLPKSCFTGGISDACKKKLDSLSARFNLMLAVEPGY